MGKGGRKNNKGAGTKVPDDDDALLDAAIQEKALSEAAAAAEAANAAASATSAAFDRLPVFTVAKEGKPMAYRIGDRQEQAIFYADVEAAKARLSATKKDTPECDVVAVGLGTAYKLSCESKGVIVPGVADLRAAGAPEGVQAMGQDLPLFVCMKLGRYVEDQGVVVPIYMSHADCAAAVKEATNADAPDTDGPLEIAPLSLQSVVDRLLDPSSPAFSFVAPTASLQHVQNYVGHGVYMRVVENQQEAVAEEQDGDAPPALA